MQVSVDKTGCMYCIFIFGFIAFKDYFAHFGPRQSNRWDKSRISLRETRKPSGHNRPGHIYKATKKLS